MVGRGSARGASRSEAFGEGFNVRPWMVSGPEALPKRGPWIDPGDLAEGGLGDVQGTIRADGAADGLLQARGQQRGVAYLQRFLGDCRAAAKDGRANESESNRETFPVHSVPPG